MLAWQAASRVEVQPAGSKTLADMIGGYWKRCKKCVN
jgi:hypothetical protein